MWIFHSSLNCGLYWAAQRQGGIQAEELLKVGGDNDLEEDKNEEEGGNGGGSEEDEIDDTKDGGDENNDENDVSEVYKDD